LNFGFPFSNLRCSSREFWKRKQSIISSSVSFLQRYISWSGSTNKMIGFLEQLWLVNQNLANHSLCQKIT
jgi:hypothetical protein